MMKDVQVQAGRIGEKVRLAMKGSEALEMSGRGCLMVLPVICTRAQKPKY